jgi:hypothetical protein
VIVVDTGGLLALLNGQDRHHRVARVSIGVPESPYFAKTRADGKAALTNLPPGAYIVRVWHPQITVAEDKTHKTIDVTPGTHAEVAWTLDLKPEASIRRAPVPGQGRRY